MSKKDMADRFSRDVDNLLHESGLSDPPEMPGDYQDNLDMARLLASTDYSRQSKVRYPLKQRLLEQIENKTISTVEIPGPWRLVANLMAHGRTAQDNLAELNQARRSKFIWAAVTSLLVVVGVTLAFWIVVEPRSGQSLLSSLGLNFWDDGESEPSGQMAVQWAFRGNGGIGPAPATDGNFVYVISNAGDVYALDARTGREIWQTQTGSPPNVAPTVGGDTVYVGGEASLFALDKFSGAQRWRAGIELSAAPIAAGSSVYAPGRDGRLMALDRQTGQARWQFQSGSAISSAPVVAGNTVFVGSQDRHLYAIDIETGRQQWRYRTGNWVASTPTIAGDTVFFGSNDEFVYALETATGNEKWRFKTGNDVFASPTVSGATVFVGSYDSRLYALDVETGQERWRFKTGKPIKSSAVVIDGVVYVGSGDGYLYGLDAETGQLLDRFETDSQIYADPVISGDSIFLVSGKGQLSMVESSPRVSEPPSPAGTLPVPANESSVFQFTPGGWYVTGDAAAIRFHGHIVDEAGNPVDGFSVQIDNGSRRFLSLPSGPSRWQPAADAGQWEVVIDNPENGGGWWWLTVGRYACPVEAEFNPQCDQFTRLSESVKVEVVYPDETSINADWICHADCEAGIR